MTTLGREGGEEPGHSKSSPGQRLDKWLWFARVVKSRTLAAEVIADGKVRINRIRVVKVSQSVRPGDVLTIALRGRVQVLKVVAQGLRRGPPSEARQLYEDLSPPAPHPDSTMAGQRPAGAGRPTKRDRRQIDHLIEED
jgi:ribosome-associated heat shock protein Hsp15